MNDVAGTVHSIGSGVTGFRLGEHVFGQAKVSLDSGGLQQYVLLDASVTGHVPPSISDDEAATMPICAFSSFVALFHSTGLDIPPPFAANEKATTFNYAAQSVVIIGGGSNCGKFGVQFASLAGIGKIIVVAGASNSALLKSYGATHIIDRHASNEEIKSQIHAITGDDLMYVLDNINREHTFGVSLLSSNKYGKMATLLRGTVDAANIGEKKAGYSIGHIFGDSHSNELGPMFWKELPAWIESGKVKPLDFEVVEGGLSAIGVNKVLDEYRDGKFPGKWNVHPNA